jgi:hypothetical protein
MACRATGTAIVCTRGHKRHAGPCVHCGRPGGLLCDYPMGGRRRRTCDLELCSSCSKKRGGADLCQTHAKLWDEKTGRPPA